MRNNSKIYSFLVILTMIFSACNSQIAVQVTKQKCIYDNKYVGDKIVINLRLDTANLKSSTEYWLSNFIDLPDNIKLLVVEKLLGFKSDTSLCCMNVVSRSFNGIEGCGGKPKDVDRYTIQLDALFMINRLCWPRLMEVYSCTPVLYDAVLEKEINSEPEKIKLVFEEYEKWFEDCKTQGAIQANFPFNDGRYIWYGGRRGISAK